MGCRHALRWASMNIGLGARVLALLVCKDKSIPFVLCKFLFVFFRCVCEWVSAGFVAIFIVVQLMNMEIFYIRKSIQVEGRTIECLCEMLLSDWYNTHKYTATIYSYFIHKSQINVDISIKHHIHIRYSRMPQWNVQQIEWKKWRTNEHTKLKAQ